MLRPADQLTDVVENTHLSDQLHRLTEFPAIVPLHSVTTAPLSWLDAQPCATKIVWSDRNDRQVVVGAGAAADIIVTADTPPKSAIDQCRRLTGNNRQLRFFGGLSFDGGHGWESFGAGRFVAPRFTLQDGLLSVTVMDRGDIGEAVRAIALLEDPSSANFGKIPSPVSLKFAPTEDGWLSTVDEALTLIRSEVLEKIVLARKTSLTFDEVVNPWSLAEKLHATTYDCFLFGFQFQPHQAFVGATPECLFRRDGDELCSEVIAGTRPRGKTSGEDQRLAYELLTSDKDQLEHDIVRKSIRQKLHKFVEHLSVDSHASVLRLAHKQHLCSAVQGKLKGGIEEAELLERLHPTPAVGGYPTDNALPEISRLEPFNRGWYAAPIGWLSRDKAEFVVGIRSARVQDRRVSLYSGAGIVRGSDPKQEWLEVDNKIRGFLDLFEV